MGVVMDVGNLFRMDLWSMPGEYDDQLKWPANAKFTVELINQTGGENVRHSRTLELEKTYWKIQHQVSSYSSVVFWNILN